MLCFVWFGPAYEHDLVATEIEYTYGVGVGAYTYDVIVR